jgi:3D (Asp-Asp-Asp) domain-containing protein
MSDKILTEISKRQKIAFVISVIILSLLATGFVWAQKQVYIIADGKKITVDTISRNPQKILAKAGIILGPHDEFIISSKNPADGDTIEVLRAVPVTLTYQGKPVEILTAKRTLREAVETSLAPEKPVKIEPGDFFHPTTSFAIKVIELSDKVVEKEVVEPYTVINEPNPKLEKGIENVVQTGEDGLKKITLRIHYEDGAEVSSEVISEEMLLAPKNQIVNVGTRNTVETSRGAVQFRKIMHMEATAYLPTDGGGHGITATGVRARWGIVAVDPRVIPLGTKVYIAGYGEALAADTGGAIKGNKIDLCMESYSQAIQFGRRTVKVYILE